MFKSKFWPTIMSFTDWCEFTTDLPPHVCRHLLWLICAQWAHCGDFLYCKTDSKETLLRCSEWINGSLPLSQKESDSLKVKTFIVNFQKDNRLILLESVHFVNCKVYDSDSLWLIYWLGKIFLFNQKIFFLIIFERKNLTQSAFSSTVHQQLLPTENVDSGH